MDIKVNIDQSLRNIMASKTRSFLALLGVLIGTGSVVALIYCGQLATASVVEQLSSLGTHLLSVTASNLSRDKSKAEHLSIDEVQALYNRHPSMKKIAPVAFTYDRLSINDQSVVFPVVGSFSDLASIGKFHLAQGRFFSVLDSGQRVCVIGFKVAEKIKSLGVLFPVGAMLKIGKAYYEIIGVGKPWPINFFFMVDMDRSVMVPISTLLAEEPELQIHDLIMKFDQHVDVIKMQQWIHADLHSLLKNSRFFFRNPKQIIDRVVAQKRTFTLLLGVIGCIALLVGGIGIMNIMLVSVTERRKEIGLRMAVGASPKDIQMLFLIEGIVLTSVGGLFGVVIGLAAAYAIAYFAHWKFLIYISPLVLGFGVSSVVGIFFGYYPARKASLVDPIVALRD